MRETVTVWYRGANYQLGQGRDFYGIWPAGVPGPQPFEWWPLTPEGWYGAWYRFTAIEVPGTIVPASQTAAVPASQTAGFPGAQPAGVPGGQPAGVSVTRPAGVPGGQPAGVSVARPAGVPGGQPDAVPGGQRTAPVASPDTRAVIAAALLAVGVGCGVAGLFPGYLAGTSLAQQPVQLVPHAIYLATWTASAVLILLGGRRRQAGALLGTGLSIVTFGLFFADAGTVIAGGTNLMGAGLVLGLVGWLACTAGSATALRLGPAGAPGRPRRHGIGSVVLLTFAAVGTAVAFAPAWDSYILRTASGATQTLTAGDAFKNPGPVIAGNVAVMVAIVAVVAAAALWRPVQQRVALLAGAVIPMAAQAISALVQVGQGTSPAQLGITPAQAAQAGLTISSGVTTAFWIYCAFVVVLAAMCTWLLIRPGSAAPGAASPPRSAGPGGADSPGSAGRGAAEPLPSAGLDVSPPALA